MKEKYKKFSGVKRSRVTGSYCSMCHKGDQTWLLDVAVLLFYDKRNNNLSEAIKEKGMRCTRSAMSTQ
jgi:hypothetical protein